MRLSVSIGAAVIAASLLPSSILAQAGKSDPKKPAKNAPTVVPDEPVDMAQPLTLDRAIQIGLKNHNALGIAQSQLEASRARVTQARSAYFPQISPSYSYTSQLTTQRFNGQTQTGTVEQSITQIGARQLIFDMGKREENVAASRAIAKGSEFNVLDARQSVIVNITTGYYDLLRRKDLVRVAQSSVDRAKTTLEATTEFANAGTAPKKDIYQAQADYDNAVVQLSVAQNDVRLAATTLKNAMGLPSTLPVITPNIKPEAPSDVPDATSVEQYMKTAFERRPDLKRESEFINADRHNVRVANINAGFQVQADVVEGYRIDPQPGENRTFATTFSYPLFDGGAARAAVRQAKASLEQSRRQLELTKQNVQLEVESALLTREESRQRAKATQAAQRAAEVNFRFATEAQREGAGTIIDIITAQNQLVTAEINAVQSIYDFYTADARLRRAIGDNDPFTAGGKQP
jgi:outer membrane protein